MAVTQEQQRNVPDIKQIDPEDVSSIAAYYQFELDHDFSTLHDGTTLESMAEYRQQQMRDGKLAVSAIQEQGKVMASTEVVLVSGTKGISLQPHEARASGTLVDPKLRGQGIGELLAAEQDRIAEAAGKTEIITTIDNDNYPSLRLRLNVGYRLEGMKRDKEPIEYSFRKQLEHKPSVKKNLGEERAAGRLPIVEAINESTPDQVLIRSDQADIIESALTEGYKGIFLLKPDDIPDDPEINTNYLVFAKSQTLSEELV